MNLDFLNEPRKAIESRILNGLVRVMTIEQYQCAKEIIVGMTDEEFFQFALESAWKYEKTASQENLRDFLNESRKMEIAMGITPQNSALNNAPSRILSKDLSDMLWKKISASQPHDVIRITYHDDDELMQLWKSGRDCKNGIAIPSDIFFAETVPLKDCVIEVDERNLPNGHIVSYRVVIFDYEEELKCADFDTAILVGAFVMPYGSGHLIMPLKVVRGVDGIVGGSVSFHGLPDDFPAFYAKEISQQESLTVIDIYCDYGAFTQEAKDKLDSIVQQHGLKLFTERSQCDNIEQLYTLLHTDAFLPAGSGNGHGAVFDSKSVYSFVTDAVIQNGKTIYYDFYLLPDGYFMNLSTMLTDASDYEETGYSVSGAEITLAIGKDRSYILADTDSYSLTVYIRAGSENENETLSSINYDTVTIDDLKLFVDSVDFAEISNIYN